MEITFVEGQVADLAGNKNAAQAEQFFVDTTPPQVTVYRLLTLDRQPPLSGTLNDPTATIQVTVDGRTYSGINNGNGTWTLPDGAIQPPLVDGVYEVHAEAVDEVGNTGSDPSSWELAIGDPPHQNPLNRVDVNNDGIVSPIDALLIVNYLNAHPGDGAPPPPGAAPPPYLDVSGDNVLAPLDALIVVNWLNQRGAGEGYPESDSNAAAPDRSRTSHYRVPRRVVSNPENTQIVLWQDSLLVPSRYATNSPALSVKDPLIDGQFRGLLIEAADDLARTLLREFNLGANETSYLRAVLHSWRPNPNS